MFIPWLMAASLTLLSFDLPKLTASLSFSETLSLIKSNHPYSVAVSWAKLCEPEALNSLA
jgi:hypothetical protein